MSYNAFADNNVLFLQGTQANLNNLIANGNAKEGAFYLTYDTHRLYIGRNNGTKVIPVAVNEGVVTVAAVANLPTTGVNAGEFYYASKENILCVYNGQQFIQINTDKDTTNASLTNTVSATANVATIETVVKDSADHEIQDTFKIKDSSGHTIIAVINEGTEQNPKYVLDLKADKYTLSSNVATESNAATATIALASENTAEDSNVKIVAGDNVNIVADGANKFKISSSYVNTVIATNGVAVELDKYDEDTNKNATGKITVSITDTAGQVYTGESEAITYKVGNTSYIPGSTLPVYTKTEVDNALNGLNGMTYKGTVGVSKSLPTLASGVSVGDTYLVDADNKISVAAGSSYSGEAITAGKGDLLIATGTETNGIITSDLKWSYVPAGDDAEHDTHYTWDSDATNNKKTLTEAGTVNVGSWQLKAGTNTPIDISSTDSNGAMITTIKHADVSHTDSSGGTENSVLSLTVVSGVEVNDQGHVTDVETTTYNLLDTTYELSGADVAAVSKGVKITHTLTGSDNDTSTSEVTVISDTLSMTAGADKSYSIDIKWGSF